MGRPFTQEAGFGRSKGGKHITVDALVDTGASYTWIPEDVLDRLQVERSQRRRFEFADGRSEFYDRGTAWIRLNGWEGPTPVVFGDVGSTPLLGCATLDDFGVAVDPVNARLIPVPLRQ